MKRATLVVPLFVPICLLLFWPSFVFGQEAPGQDHAERTAGTWRPWVLRSGSQFRLPPPPDAADSLTEARQLRTVMAELDDRSRARAAWWGAVAPSYRWNQIAIEASVRASLNANIASRRLAILHIALADGMTAAWDSKYAHNRPRPNAVDANVRPAIMTPASPSYPDEHAVAATIGSAVLSALFPDRAADFERLADEARRSRVLAGVAFPTDVTAGDTLGRSVAAAVLDRARADLSDRPWAGTIPTTAGSWNGTNPILPQAATWRPWLLASPDEFRPGPPAAYDSPERAAEMQRVRDYPRTPATNARALFWEVAVGGLRNYEYWNAHLARLLLESGQGMNAPRAARDFALFQAAFYDAGVACWDGKYAYWTIRPFQFDKSFTPVFTTPNHPSYPAAHACYSMTSARVLAHLYPSEADALLALARESGESRIWAGIHYPSDVAAGQAVAEGVARKAIERARSDGAERN